METQSKGMNRKFTERVIQALIKCENVHPTYVQRNANYNKEMPFYLSNYPRIEKKCMKQAKLYIESINIIFHQSGELCIKSLKKKKSLLSDSANSLVELSQGNNQGCS